MLTFRMLKEVAKHVNIDEHKQWIQVAKKEVGVLHAKTNVAEPPPPPDGGRISKFDADLIDFTKQGHDASMARLHTIRSQYPEFMFA